MWESIQKAQGYVWVSTFIIEDDSIGQRTIQELTDAAKKGVKSDLAPFRFHPSVLDFFFLRAF